MKIAIAAAGGNVGSRVAKELSKLDVEMVLLGRNTSSLKKTGITDAKISITDLSNRDQVLQATEGVDALFWLVPPVLSVPSLKKWYQQVTEAGVFAVKKNKIKKVVLLSSLGAGASENLGTVSYCGAMEKEFDTLDANVLALRPGYFMENFILQSQRIMETGSFAFTFASNHDIPFVSADDIGDIAVKYLMDNSWSGHWKLNVMGPENITMNKAAEYMSKVLEKKIVYQQLNFEASKAQFKNMGVSDTVQNELIDLLKALGDPEGVYATPRTPEGHSPTTLEGVIERKLKSE